MREYLEAYRSAIYKGPMPAGMREPLVILAALRERMLALAATAADGAFPYLVTDRAAGVDPRRARRGGRCDRRPSVRCWPSACPSCSRPIPAAARSAARHYLLPYLRTPNYQAAWAEQGFEAADWERPGSDRLVDAMVAWGDADALRARLGEVFAAGADHVALIPVDPARATPSTSRSWRPSPASAAASLAASHSGRVMT